MESKLVKAKDLDTGDYIYHPPTGRLAIIKNIYTLYNYNQEYHTTFDKIDKKEVSFSTKRPVRVRFVLECPRTKAQAIFECKPKFAFKVPSKAVMDVLYGDTGVGSDGNLVAGAENVSFSSRTLDDE